VEEKKTSNAQRSTPKSEEVRGLRSDAGSACNAYA
jgi:hypothetical protein